MTYNHPMLFAADLIGWQKTLYMERRVFFCDNVSYSRKLSLKPLVRVRHCEKKLPWYTSANCKLLFGVYSVDGSLDGSLPRTRSIFVFFTC